MAELHLYRSVELKKSELTAAALTEILNATTHGIGISDPNIYIMVRVQENISDAEYLNHQRPVTSVIGSVQFATASSKGNPPGTNTLP